MSSEYQKVIDNESEKASKDTGKLIFYLMKKGRVDDAEKAIEDKYYRAVKLFYYIDCNLIY